MAKCELAPMFKSVSGKLSSSKTHNVILKHFKDGKTRMYIMPKRQRTTAVKPEEIECRTAFSEMAKMVAEKMRNGDKRPKKAIWAEVRKMFHAGNALVLPS